MYFYLLPALSKLDRFGFYIYWGTFDKLIYWCKTKYCAVRELLNHWISCTELSSFFVVFAVVFFLLFFLFCLKGNKQVTPFSYLVTWTAYKLDLQKKIIILFATKLTKEIPDPVNAKEYYQSYLKTKNKKSVKRPKIFTRQPKLIKKLKYYWVEISYYRTSKNF